MVRYLQDVSTVVTFHHVILMLYVDFHREDLSLRWRHISLGFQTTTHLSAPYSCSSAAALLLPRAA